MWTFSLWNTGGRMRSVERRVGKECRSRWWPHHQKKELAVTSQPSCPTFKISILPTATGQPVTYSHHRRATVEPDSDGEHLHRFFFQAEDGIRDIGVTGVQTCALPILWSRSRRRNQPLRLVYPQSASSS